MKRKLLVFFLCIFAAFYLIGCKNFEVGVNELTASYSDVYAIPEDGIVAKEVFENLKDTKSIATFEGESNGIKYEWTVFGSDITDPKDLDLSISITKPNDSLVIISYNSKENFGFAPLLSIHSGMDNDGKIAFLAKIEGNIRKKLSDVSLTGADLNILNISFDSQVGTYTVFIEDERDAFAKADNTESVKENVSEESSKENDKTSGNMTSDNKKVDASEMNKTTENALDEYLSKPTTGGGSAIAGTGKGGATASTDSSGRVLSDGTQTGKDQYLTDPVPFGKPLPVEPENQVVDKSKALSCTFSIECSTILNNLKDLKENKVDAVPPNGVIFPAQTVTFYEGESVFDVLKRICSENQIQVQYKWSPMYNSTYVEGIHNLYEFDCGPVSGWMYKVDGWYAIYGCERYVLTNGETVEWRYTCDLGADIGGQGALGN